jgi:cytosine/adenosine deaminase-related metal-dependent hydrolase
MRLRARTVVPVARPPIEDGVVCVEGGRIAWAGPRVETPATLQQGDEIDLGEVILLPGLVNAHCHLDYTGMAGQIAPPKSFTDWIKSMVSLKGSWSLGEFESSWHSGAAMLLRTGTTTVADIEAVPELIPAAWERTPLRIHSFRELINVRSRVPAAEMVENAVNDWLSLPATHDRVGLSPHAPYTTSTELLELAARAAHRRKWRLTTHIAESEQEFEMYMYRQGAMFEWLKGQRDVSECGAGSPIQHLERCGYLDENLLAVHVNYLWRHDAGVLGRNEVSVAHCPRSHAYFQHLRFPREELESAGVNICLGTDSLATARKERDFPLELNLFSEMQMFAGKSPDVRPETILRMATLNGARALGMKGLIGELSEGAYADLIAIPSTPSGGDAYDSILQHRGNVVASMIDGHWAIPPRPA